MADRLAAAPAWLVELDAAKDKARAAAEAAAADLEVRGLKAQHAQLLHQRTEAMRELDRKRAELAAFEVATA
jgi:hypothetical protein